MSEDETAAVIRRSQTDQDRHITFDPDSRPGVSALLSTAALCQGRGPEEIADDIGGKGSGELKRVVTDTVNSFLFQHRARRKELANDPTLATRILAQGNARANQIANITLDEVHDAMGTKC